MCARCDELGATCAFCLAAAEGKRHREREEAAAARLHEWQTVNNSKDQRMPVPGGWIYFIYLEPQPQCVFVPEPR